MSINTSKSTAITIMKDKIRKYVILLARHFETSVGTIKPMGVSDQQKYLGLSFSWKGRLPPKSTHKLSGMFSELSAAPLKPYQPLEILNTYLLPKLTQELGLRSAHRNTLKRIDVMVQTD